MGNKHSAVLSLLLDAFEPLAPIVAQLLWVAQPTMGVFVATQHIDEWARLLETPEGVEQLRARLLEDNQNE